MDVDFQAKVEKYESKAAKYREAALKATEGAQRTMCDVLAGYYAELATDSGRPLKNERGSEPQGRQQVPIIRYSSRIRPSDGFDSAPI